MLLICGNDPLGLAVIIVIHRCLSTQVALRTREREEAQRQREQAYQVCPNSTSPPQSRAGYHAVISAVVRVVRNRCWS